MIIEVVLATDGDSLGRHTRVYEFLLLSLLIVAKPEETEEKVEGWI